MVHPDTGDIYLVSKGGNTAGLIRVMRYPGPLSSGETKQLEVVATYQLPPSAAWNPTTGAGAGNHQVTGGDIRPGGTGFALRTYGRIWQFSGATFADALADPYPTQLKLPVPSLDQQGEAFAFSPDGSRYFTIGEKSSTLRRSIVYFEPN